MAWSYIIPINSSCEKSVGLTKHCQRRPPAYLNRNLLLVRVCYAVSVMARKLSQDERARIAEKIMEIGNLVLAALVVGQVLSSRIDLITATAGVGVFGLAYFVGYQIMKRG